MSVASILRLKLDTTSWSRFRAEMAPLVPSIVKYVDTSDPSLNCILYRIRLLGVPAISPSVAYNDDYKTLKI